MKYKPKIYAQAFGEIAAGKQEKEIIENFLNLIKKNGDFHQIGKIIEETEKFMRQKEGRRKITLESARSLKNPRQVLRNFLKESDILEEKINSDLIAGMKIIIDDEKEFDASLKQKIEKLFS